MPIFATTQPQVADDLVYCQTQVMPSVEGDLLNGVAIADPWIDACLAIVQFSTVGPAGVSYVVMQTDLGDGNWVDVAWCQYSQSGPQVNVLSGGGGASGPASPGPQRTANVAPSTANGVVAILLGPRIRFVGKGPAQSSSPGPGSSGAAGNVVNVTIKYKVFGKR